MYNYNIEKTMKKYRFYAVACSLLLGFAACSSEIEHGTTDIDDWEMPYEPVEGQYVYNHPCAMYSQADFDRVKASLEAGSAPQAVKDEFALLKASQFAQLTYTPSPLEYIVRGDASGITPDGKEKYMEAMRDAAAAYQLALLWKLTGDDAYADTGVNILNQWAATCKGVTSNDANHVLAAGGQGYTFANAAEIFQTYSGWKADDLTAYKAWMKKVFATVNREFMTTHGNTCNDHYWSNWDLVNMCSYFAIGVLCEDDEMVDYVVNYFYNGASNGYIGKLIQATFTDPLGTGEQIAQNQESGRDQGHAMMSAAVAANLAQMAYTLYTQNPEIAQLDFFAANDNALMKMGEYVALSNLRDGADQLNLEGKWIISTADIPFQTYEYCIDCSCKDKNHGTTQTEVANDAGRGTLRPGWEIFYNHYAKVKNLPGGYKYAEMAAAKMRPEAGVDGGSRYGTNSGAFDQLGWGTLMLYR